MAAILPPSVLPDISLSMGEINCGTRFRSQLAAPPVDIERGALRLSTSPLEGEMSGRTEGGKRHALRGQTHAR